MDWQKLVQDLISLGFTQAELAEHCGVSQSSISALSTGVTKAPRYDIADKLRAIHAARCGAAAES